MLYLHSLLSALRVFMLGSIFENFYCNPSAFVENTRYMGIGMLAIFIVIGIIVGVTYLLNEIFRDKNQ